MRPVPFLLPSIVLPLICSLALTATPAPAQPAASAPTSKPAADAGGGAEDLPLLVWDLSDAQPLARVGWPKVNTERDWRIMGPMRVDLRLPDGKRMQGTFAMAHLFRNGGRVRVVQLFTPIEDLEPAYQRAAQWLKDWGMEAERPALDAWHEKRKKKGVDQRDPEGHNYSSSPDPDPKLPWNWGLEVLWTYSDTKPWAVKYSIGFRMSEPMVKDK